MKPAGVALLIVLVVFGSALLIGAALLQAVIMRWLARKAGYDKLRFKRFLVPVALGWGAYYAVQSLVFAASIPIDPTNMLSVNLLTGALGIPLSGLAEALGLRYFVRLPWLPSIGVVFGTAAIMLTLGIILFFIFMFVMVVIGVLAAVGSA